jgi:predicted amidohydrolase
MKVGFFQFNPAFGEIALNLEQVAGRITHADIDLVVLPEFFATGYQFTSSDEARELSEYIPGGLTTKTLTDISKDRNIYIVAGLPECAGQKYFNSAILTGPEGFIGVYRKTHLFFEEKLYFSPGDTGFRVWDTEVGKIGIMICFDWFFPEAMRTLALMGADIIAHPSNLVLPYCPQGMLTRCLENHIYAITANRTGLEERREGQPLKFIGQSQIVSPQGKAIVRASENDEALISTDIDVSKSKEKSINQFNDLFMDRRPETYKL